MNKIAMLEKRIAEFEAAKAALRAAVVEAFPIGSSFTFSYGYHKTTYPEPLKPRLHSGTVTSEPSTWHDPLEIGVVNDKTGKGRRVNVKSELGHNE